MAPPRKLAPALFPKPVTAAVLRSNSQNKFAKEQPKCTCNRDDEEDIFETWKSQLEQRKQNDGLVGI